MFERKKIPRFIYKKEISIINKHAENIIFFKLQLYLINATSIIIPY